MRTKQNWPLVIEQYHKSDKSKVAYCKENNISYHSFLMHLKRSADTPSDGFRQIVVGSDPINDRIDFHFADGRCVCFPVHTPKDLIHFLLSL